VPAKRIPMRKIREVLRLRFEAGRSIRQISASASTKTSVGAIQKLLSRTQALNLAWPLPRDLDDGRLAALFTPMPIPPPRPGIRCPTGPPPIRSSSVRVTKQLLWEEYTARCPNRCTVTPNTATATDTG